MSAPGDWHTSLSIQLAETRGELRELILGVSARQEAHGDRIASLEEAERAQWRKIDELHTRSTTTTAIRRTWATVGTILGTVLGVASTLIGASIL